MEALLVSNPDPTCRVAIVDRRLDLSADPAATSGELIHLMHLLVGVHGGHGHVALLRSRH